MDNSKNISQAAQQDAEEITAMLAGLPAAQRARIRYLVEDAKMIADATAHKAGPAA